MADGSETWPSSVADGNVNPDGSRDDEGILYPQLETSMSTLSSSSLSLPTSSSSFSFSSPSSVEEIPTEEDWEVAEVLIRELWSRFAVEGAREVIRVPHLGKEAREARRLGKLGDRETNARIAGADLAKQYMEVFRFNR